MNASCYIWKWADNDLPGRPTEVHSALLRGELHPAVQPFDARPVLAAIKALAKRSPAGEQDQWNWCAAPAENSRQAHFVFLNCPQTSAKTIHQALARRLLRYDVTCFDENLGVLGDWFPPKLNEFQCGQWSGEMLYDISDEDLPVLIKGITPGFSDPFAVLTNRHTHFVQCLRKSKGYFVEWRENDIKKPRNFNHWRAQDIEKLAALKVPYQRTGIAAARNPDLLRFAETLNIFRAFLLRQPRPARYHWMNINHWLK